MFEHKKILFLLIIFTLLPLGPAALLTNSIPHNSQLQTCLKVPSTKICLLDGIRKRHRTGKNVLQAISNIMHSSSLVTSDTMTPVNHVCQCSYGHNLTWKLTQDTVLKKMMPSKVQDLARP
jgi:hypothetical protein